MPLHRRLPKKGFNNTLFRYRIEVVNVGQMDAAFEEGTTVTHQALSDAGLVNKTCDKVKVLGNGDITRKLTFQGLQVSATAKEKIEKAGGSIAA